jgi:hypothetical protein
MLHPRLAAIAIALLLVATSATAHALNKQGLSVPVDEPSDAPTLNLTGYVFGGTMLYNPSYAARPDNSGLALGRAGGHADLDLYGKRLTLTYDGNLFSDRLAGEPLRPSEVDHIVGVLTRHGDLELGAHFETDTPADRPGTPQTYADVAARAYLDLFERWRGLREALPRQGFTGFVTVAGFVYNPSYAARPDLSGLALLRGVAHAEIDLLRPWLTLSIDLNAFTDRTTSAGLVPSELDSTVGVTIHLGTFDVSLVGENDRPVDRAGLDMSYVSTLVTYRFDVQQTIARMRADPEVARAMRAPW